MKEKAKIGTLALVRNHRTGKDGKKYDLVIVEVLDPVTGNKIKLNGIVGYEKSKYPHVEKDRTTGQEIKVPKNYTTLQFDGVKFKGSDKYDYNFKPVVTLDEGKPAPVQPKLKLETAYDPENPF